MTIQGAMNELINLLNADDIPIYYKGCIKKVIETIDDYIDGKDDYFKRKTENCSEDISQEDFGTLCICALRYCHGRRTYMPSLVQSIVVRHFKDLSDRDLKVIADDEQFQSDIDLWGDTCDMVNWKNFYQILRELQTEREGE